MKKNKIRVGLLNVQSGIGTTKGYCQYLLHMRYYYSPHGSEKIEALGRLAQNEKIDILATVEIDQGSARTRQIDQTQLLSQSGSYDHGIFFPTLTIGSMVNQGNAIHSRFPIGKSKFYMLPGKGEPRSVGAAVIDVGRPVNFFVTHLSLELPFRQAQINALSEIIDNHDAPMVMLGDFSIQHKGELELLESGKLQQLYSAKTYPVWKPKRWLDYVFTSGDITIKKGRVSKERLSDHCLLMVDLSV